MMDDEDKYALIIGGIVILFILCLCINSETRPW